MDFVNREFSKDFIGNSLRISLGIFWTKVGLDFDFVKMYNGYNSARIVDKEMKHLLFLCLKIERRIIMTKEIYKYLKIPYEVSECKNICSTAKLLYGRLLLLEYKHGYIHASNNYLATIFNMSERSITRLLSSLSENNFITIVGRDNFHRKIYLNVKNDYVDRNK